MLLSHDTRDVMLEKEDHTCSFTKKFIVYKSGWPFSSLPHFPRQSNQDNVKNGTFNFPNCQWGIYVIGGMDKYQAGCWKDTCVIGIVGVHRQVCTQRKASGGFLCNFFLFSASKKPYVLLAGVSSINLKTHTASLKVTVPSRHTERW